MVEICKKYMITAVLVVAACVSVSCYKGLQGPRGCCTCGGTESRRVCCCGRTTYADQHVDQGPTKNKICKCGGSRNCKGRQYLEAMSSYNQVGDGPRGPPPPSVPIQQPIPGRVRPKG